MDKIMRSNGERETKSGTDICFVRVPASGRATNTRTIETRKDTVTQLPLFLTCTPTTHAVNGHCAHRREVLLTGGGDAIIEEGNEGLTAVEDHRHIYGCSETGATHMGRRRIILVELFRGNNVIYGTKNACRRTGIPKQKRAKEN
eukprot:9175292-Pyramimonas_sp.AAC.1